MKYTMPFLTLARNSYQYQASQKDIAVTADTVHSRTASIILHLLVLTLAFAWFASERVHAKPFKSPEILVLGDSQLSFGAGPLMLDFFKNISSHCSGLVDDTALLKGIEKMRTTLIGARSSSLQSWITKTGRARQQLCRKDAKWGVNASVWGSLKLPKRTYVQIGEEKNFRFCKPNKTPLQVMFDDGKYMPRLVVFNLLGNGAARWAGMPKEAKKDALRVANQLPKDVACIYMTTMPNYTKSRNKRRLKAQKNIEAAFAQNGNRCTFVRSLTPKTIAAIEGNSNHFRKRKSGTVKDPFHPGKNATKKVLSLRRKALCSAMVAELGMPEISQSASSANASEALHK